MPGDRPGWTGLRRCDGVEVVQPGEEGTWIIKRCGHAALTACPCCDLPFKHSRAAQLVADAMWPLAGESVWPEDTGRAGVA
jgi:hypothetical protein